MDTTSNQTHCNRISNTHMLYSDWARRSCHLGIKMSISLLCMSISSKWPVLLIPLSMWSPQSLPSPSCIDATHTKFYPQIFTEFNRTSHQQRHLSIHANGLLVQSTEVTMHAIIITIEVIIYLMLVSVAQDKKTLLKYFNWLYSRTDASKYCHF